MAAILNASIDTLLAEYERREKRKGQIYNLFPDSGPYRRELYPQHLEFFRSGAHVMARLAMCANGVGKTLSMGGFEVALHLTGLYPDWWPGFRYKRPVRFWIAGETKTTTRQNQQKVLLGEPKAEEEGGGLIPADLIDMKRITRWPGGGGLIESCFIKHVPTGSWSYLGARTYDPDYSPWMGENLDGVWMDEPAPILHYQEGVTRTRGSENPCIMVTFTPKKGATELVNLFVNEPDESRRVIPCTWDDVPHLTEEWKRNALANVPRYMRDTVSKGIPTLGIGAVYPIEEDRFVIDPLDEIPDHWPRAIGFDGGWHCTAAIWGAWDRETDTWYLYDEHRAGELLIPVHAAAIQSRGPWIPIIGDVRHTSVTDGEKMIEEYADNGLDIIPASKPGAEARREKVRKRLITSKIKVFSTLRHWLNEYRTYHYDDHGNVRKKGDHLMDATQYLIAEGPHIAKTRSETIAVASTEKPVRFGRKI